jgi:hypothetical protein
MRRVPPNCLTSIVILLTLAGCAHAVREAPTGADLERVVIVDMDGEVARLNTATDRITMSFNSPIDHVWAAVITAYAELELEANYADRANGRYGVRGLRMPNTLRGQRIDRFFDCGSTRGGPLIDSGTLVADIVTALAPSPDGSTSAAMFAAGTLRRTHGSSSSPVVCSSTCRLERLLRRAVDSLIAPAPLPAK